VNCLLDVRTNAAKHVALLWLLSKPRQLPCCCAYNRECRVPAGGKQRPDSGSSGGSVWHHVPDGSEDDDGDLPPPVRRSWTQRLWGDGGGGI
jgi:hypothetical protein